MPIANLDYPNAKLAIEVMNPAEQKYRQNACQKEPWTTTFLESIPPGAVFWDIGANVGPYTLIAAHRNLTTIAVEPGFNNYAALCRNLAMNNLLDRCLCLCLALGAEGKYDWLHYRDMRQGAASHILGGVRKQTFHKQIIPIWTWDFLAPTLPLPPARPWFAKIDVDGGELAVLRGAPEALQRLTGLIIEMHECDEGAITELLTQAGLPLVERYDQRGGKEIAGMAYGKFVRG